MPQPKPFRNSHAPAQPSEETEFPRFKKPVGALAEAASQAGTPAAARSAKARQRSSRFLFGFMTGVLAAGLGVAVVFLILIRGDLDSLNPASQSQRREAKVIAPEIYGAPLPLEAPAPRDAEPAPAVPPEEPPAPAPPPTPPPRAPSALNQTRLFVHHSNTPPQAAVATDIAGQLRGGGLSVIDIRRIQGTISAGSVRFFFPADREAAAGLAEMLGRFYRGRNDPQEFRLLDFTHYNPKPREHTLEIWLPD
jgi:hypothetical protein